MPKQGKPRDQQPERAWAEDILRREAAGERISRVARRQARRVLGEEWKPSVETQISRLEGAYRAKVAAADVEFEATKAQIQAATQEKREALQRQHEADAAARNAAHEAKMAALRAELDALPEEDDDPT